MNELFQCRESAAGHDVGGCCVDTYRIYDSCIGQECLRNLRFCTTNIGQALLNTASALRIRDTSVLWVQILSEEVPFRTGYYNITARYFFRITLEACQGLGVPPAIVVGIACYDKNVILYGGSGSISVFSSDAQQSFCGAPADFSRVNLIPSTPRIIVEAAPPVGLEVTLVEGNPDDGVPCCQNLPAELADTFEGTFDPNLTITQSAYITLGLFSIIRVERPAQLKMDSCENCFPDKTCEGASTYTDTCSLFNNMEFPYEQFAPAPQNIVPDLSADRLAEDPTISPADYT